MGHPEEIAYAEIEQEFKETLGYIRQDIAAIRKKDLGLNYTVALLICCGCEAIAKHQGRPRHHVFTSLLPDQEPYKTLGKPMYEALRDGLAHGFRPKTVKVGRTLVRFTISWRNGRHLSVLENTHSWIVLNILELENRLTAKIDEYQAELRQSGKTRSTFLANSEKKITLEIREHEAPLIASAWKAALRIGRGEQ
jgi:hypothetical protein